MRKKPDEFNYEYCRSLGGCAYMSKTPSCDYFLITGRRRPCPAGEGCTEHTAIKKPAEHPAEIDVASGLRIYRKGTVKKSAASAVVKADKKEGKMEGTGKKRGYTFDTEKAYELYRQGLTDSAIGKACGIGSNSIYNWRKKNNLPANKRTAASDGSKRAFDPQQARALYDAKYTDKEIGAKLGVSAWSIGNWRRKEGLPSNPKITTDGAPPADWIPPSTSPPAANRLSLGDFAKAMTMLAEIYGNADFEVIADAENAKYSEVAATVTLTAACAIESVVINLY